MSRWFKNTIQNKNFILVLENVFNKALLLYSNKRLYQSNLWNPFGHVPLETDHELLIMDKVNLF